MKQTAGQQLWGDMTLLSGSIQLKKKGSNAIHVGSDRVLL